MLTSEHRVVVRIGYMRGRHGITQEEMARRLGVTRQQLSRIENGHQGLSLQRALEMVLQYGGLEIQYRGRRFMLDFAEFWNGRQ